MASYHTLRNIHSNHGGGVAAEKRKTVHDLKGAKGRFEFDVGVCVDWRWIEYVIFLPTQVCPRWPGENSVRGLQHSFRLAIESEVPRTLFSPGHLGQT